MDKLLVKYRTWYQAIPPHPIKLQIPGWAGEPNDHKTGDRPQPWHCPPFVEGSTYGLELCYPFDTECHVQMKNGEISFDGDFTVESSKCNVTLPPFLAFAPGHFGMTSSLDIKVPPGYVLRTETHPKFYTDESNTTPCCIPGHIQTEWWPRIFFVVFKNPMPGQTIIFRKGEPYGQVLIVPKKIVYDIQEMSQAEIVERNLLEDTLINQSKKFVKNDRYDYKGNNFDDKYKILSTVFAKDGVEGVKNFLNKSRTVPSKKPKIKNLLVKKRKNESVQDQEKKL